jgi:hypothetical protein
MRKYERELPIVFQQSKNRIVKETNSRGAGTSGHRRLKVTVRIVQSMVGNTLNFEINYDQSNPPIIFFDTNVWRSINDANIATLQDIQQKYGFHYRYSVTNFVELASHLEDQPSKSCRKPFQMFQSCFRRIRKICDRDILPSPEMVFLAHAGLGHYIDPIWIPDVLQMALAVELITNANSLAELTGEGDRNTETAHVPKYIVKPSHYRNLRDIDGDSMRAIMEELHGFKRPISVDDRLVQWFVKLSHFFLFVRPTSRMFLQNLTSEEQNRFLMALMEGVGRLFQTHCMSLVKKTVNDGRKVDPNDLYDMLQLILLENNNALFVTSEKTFFLYQIDHDYLQRVLPWTSFVSAV